MAWMAGREWGCTGILGRATRNFGILYALNLGIAAELTAQRSNGQSIPATWPADAATPAAERPLELPRLGGPITLDGRLDDPAWQAVPPVPLIMLWPTHGGEMTQASSIRIAYDGEALWAAGHFEDLSEEGVRANGLQRDRWTGDDAFDLIVDPFNDDRTALKFTAFPRGALLDEEILNDADFRSGIEPINANWNGFWEAQAVVSDTGWTVEMRIPFSTLRFQPSPDGEVVMGVIAARYIARENEKHIFPAVTPDHQMPDFKPSLARDVVLRDVPRTRLLEIRPYALAGTAGQTLPAGVPDTPLDRPREVGLDVKVGLTSNLTADFSANMDFAQAESDALLVNLGRFNLFFPEKRGFFQERSSVFAFNLSEETRLFHSRRIGLTPDGTPLRIQGAARVVGRIGSVDLGAMSLQVDGDGTLPGENVSALRTRRTWGSGASAGGMLTMRWPAAGAGRIDAGFDGTVALGSARFLTLQAAHTGTEGAPASMDRALIRLFAEKRGGSGLAGNLDIARAGPGFDPALGFMERTDYTAAKSSVRHTWQRDAASAFSWYRAIGTARTYFRNEDGSLESGLLRAQWNGVLKGAGAFVNAAFNLEYEDLAAPLELPGDVAVPAGSYLGPNLFLSYWMPGQHVSVDWILHVGTFLDGWRTSAEINPIWRPSPHFTGGLEARLNRLWFPVRDDVVDAHSVRLRLGVAADTRLSAESFVQYESAFDRWSMDARIRYRFQEGRDLYLVFTGSRDLDARFEGLGSSRTSRHQVLLKYAHTFRP